MPAPARLQELPPVRALVRLALGKIAYVHCFKLLESAGEDEQAKEAEQDSKNHGLGRRQGQAQLAKCVSGKCYRSAMLPIGDELRGARLKSEPNWRNFGLRNHVTLNRFDRSAHVTGSP